MPSVAFRAIRSRRKFIKAPEVKKKIGAVMDSKVKPHFIQRFDFVVANWEHKVEFKARKYIRPDSLEIYVFPAGENKQIYTWVTLGTPAHPIPKTPKMNGTLAFLWGGKGSYKAKTKPVGKFGGPGVVAGGTMHFPKQVQHPGTEPRDFESVIAADGKPWYNRTMENAWRRIIRSL